MSIARSTRRLPAAAVVAVAAALFAAPALAQETAPMCGDAGSFPLDPAKTRLARVTPGPALHFVRTEAVEGCPSDKAACVRKPYVVAGDVLVTGLAQGPFVCAAFPGGMVGLVRRDRLEPVAAPPQPRPGGLADWQGDWELKDADAQAGTHSGFTLTPAHGALHATGLVNFVFDAEKGDVSTGEFDLRGTPVGDRLHIGSKSDDDCGVDFWRLGPYLVAKDNGACGGNGASFDGVYRRKRPQAARAR